jgi:phospholipase C
MPIKHIVVLMLENRSFDHIFGYLDVPGVEGIGAGQSNPTDIGWGGHPAATIAAFPSVVPGAYVVDPDPPHEYSDVTLQLFGQPVVPVPAKPTNQGFVMAYSQMQGSNGQPVGLHVGQQIMGCFTPAQLPVLSKLARNYTLCDHWFASVPGPTWPNRFFAHAATSGGLAESPSDIASMVDALGIGGFNLATIYDHLSAQNVPWAIYFHDFPQARAIRSVNARPDRLLPFQDFVTAAKVGSLPAYSFIEPRYFSIPTAPPPNDMHPSHDVRNGERLVAQVYDALRSGDPTQWNETLLVVVFDEHGGFFDHVPPPAAPSPDGIVARNGFAFDRLGLRVPAILVSPLMDAKVVKRTFDHTSILATAKKIFGLPKFLTARDAAADTFEDLLLPAPRPDAQLPRNLQLLCSPGAAATPSAPLSDYQKSLVSVASALHQPVPGAG